MEKGKVSSNKNKEKEKNDKSKKIDLYKKIFIISLSISIFIFLVSLLMYLNSKNNMNDTYILAEKILNRYQYKYIFDGENGNKVTIIEKSKDVNYDYSYVEASLIEIPSKSSFNTEIEIGVYKYNSKNEAKAKIKFINSKYKILHKYIDNTFLSEYDEYKSLFTNEKNYIFNVDSYVIEINEKYSSYYKELKSFIVENIQKTKKSKNEPSSGKLDKYWNSELDKISKKYKKLPDEKIEQTKNDILDYLNRFDSCTREMCKKYYEYVTAYEKYGLFNDEIEKVKNKYNEVMISVIDFKNISYDDAVNWCNANNLKSCSVSLEYSNYIANGQLISQSINANEVIKKDEKIVLIYSKGKEPSLEYKNALSSAKKYLSVMPFSYLGLIHQLEYENYPHDAAVYAVDNCGADWNEQAVKKAKQYLSVMSFSHSGLVKQLMYEKFTREQAEYGVSQAGL